MVIPKAFHIVSNFSNEPIINVVTFWEVFVNHEHTKQLYFV